MAKVKYDVSDVEPGQDIDFDTPIPKGLYKCKVSDITSGTSQSSGNPMLTVEYEVVQRGDWKGRKLWDYIVLTDEAAWKLRQFTDALGKRAKGTLDTDALVGEMVLVRVKHETDNRPEVLEANAGKPVVRGRVGNVAAIPDTDDEEPEDDDEADEPADGDDDEDLTYEDLAEYDRDDMEALVEDEELDITFNKRTKDDVLRERIAEALELEPEDDDDDEDEEEEAWADMSLADLRTEAKARGLSTKGPKAKLVARLEEDDEGDGNEPF